MKKFFIACLMLMSLTVMSGYAWAAEDDGTEEKEKKFLFMGNLKAWGINGAVGYRLPEILEERDSILWLMLGTRIEHRGYYRTVDDEFYHGSAHDYDDFTYWAGHLNWAVGFSQALINDDRKDTDLLYISLFYKGVCEDYYEEDDDQILFNSNRFDKEGLWQNSLIFEITYDSVLKDKDTAMRKGLYVSGSLEYAPKLAINDFRGEADFIKYAFELRYFVPVVKFDEDNLLAGVYFGTSFLWDYIEGDKIPLYARQHITSTLATTAALGGLVRGYEKYRFDSELKWASRNEFRFNTRKFHIKDVYNMDVFLRFSALGFFDFGYYGTTDGDDGDMICSSGVGVLASFMDILSVSMYLAWPMAEKRLDGYRVVPVFGFGFKF